MFLCTLLTFEMIYGSAELSAYPESATIVISRFSCGLILHLRL
jgi:hypothetical protein